MRCPGRPSEVRLTDRLRVVALEPAVDEYDQLRQRYQIERTCRSEAEKYACKVIDAYSVVFLTFTNTS